MRKIILVIALGFSSMAAMAAEIEVCKGTAGPAAAAITGADDGSLFVRNTFTAQCSQDSLVTVDQDAVALWGGSASRRGGNFFAGSTNGGAIVPGGKCTDSKGGCGAGDITSAMTKAAALGKSS